MNKSVNNGVDLTIGYYLNFSFRAADKEKMVEFLIDQIKQNNQNYIGFKNKKCLANFLLEEILGLDSTIRPLNKKIKQKEAHEIIRNTIMRCHNLSKGKTKLKIHIFPSYNKFINAKMSGVSGYTSNSQNILIFLSPQTGWKTALKNTLAHEFTHTKALKYHRWQTLLDSLIFEGLADNFRESTIGGAPAPWSVALSPIKAKNIFIKLKKRLNSKDENLYSEIFLGHGNKYPLWSGYTIGYQIVKLYLKRNRDKAWPKIFKLKICEILKQSRY